MECWIQLMEVSGLLRPADEIRRSEDTERIWMDLLVTRRAMGCAEFRDAVADHVPGVEAEVGEGIHELGSRLGVVAGLGPDTQIVLHENGRGGGLRGGFAKP